MRHYCIAVLSVLATLPLGSHDALAKPLSLHWDVMHTKHSWNTIPKNWESVGSPSFGTTIDLYFALKPYRDNALIDALYEVSSPGHPKYRAHLSKAQVAELVAPHPKTLELVNSWLEHHGVPSSSISMTHSGNTLMLKGVSVTQANALLNASYQLYRHVERNETLVRTIGYALPAALHGHVLTVVPTTSFVSPPAQWQMPRNRSGGEAAGQVNSASGGLATMPSNRGHVDHVTPSFLSWLYGTSTYTPTAMHQNVLGIAGYSGQFPSQADLIAFMHKYGSLAADAVFDYTVILINGGGYDPFHPLVEANLGIQYAEAMAYPTPLIFYGTGKGPSGTQDWYISWLSYILFQPNIPQTIGASSIIDEDTLSREYALYVCDLFAQLGLLGVSVLFPSGGNGVGQGSCVTNDGSVQFRPKFPATCPWVTAVGGTTGFDPEVAAGFSGGGFSNYFLLPSYQEQAVSTFFQDLGDRYKGLYNASGRGIPDISAQAIGFPIFLNGIENVGYGTGGSTVVVASIISLLNDYLLSRGQAPLGFLNPWLYGSGFEALWDIASGSNPGCDTEGFSAIDGWDPVTGLGTSDFGHMQSVVPYQPRVTETTELTEL